MTYELITKLYNPKSSAYLLLKDYVKSGNFTWRWMERSTKECDSNQLEYTNIPFYSHLVLLRPELNAFQYSSEEDKSLSREVALMIKSILNFNKIEFNYFLRININCVHPQQNKILTTFPHTDHKYSHNNLLIYLTDAGGDTIVENEKFSPKEDDVIIFPGVKHCHQTPSQERRIVIVATYN